MPKIKKKSYNLKQLYYLNLFIIFGIIFLKICDLVSTYIGISTYGGSIEGNLLMLPILSNGYITLIISFFPIILGSLVNYFFRKDKLILIALFIVLTSCFILLSYVVYNNIQMLRLWGLWE